MKTNNKGYFPQWLSFILVMCLASVLNSCEENQFGVLDTKGNAPSVSAASVTPDSINIDNLTPVGNTYTINAVTRLTVSDPEGTDDLNSVIVQAIRPGASSQFFQQNLHDDGVAPDGVAGDSIFSAEIQFEIIRALAGRYRMQFIALDNEGNQSNVLERTLFITRNNSAPSLSDLVAPDTVDLPVGGSIVIQFTVVASDSDGLADIRDVYFERIDPPDPSFTKFFLLDDGGVDLPGPLGLRSGDNVAGDGRFSVLVPLIDGQAQRRTNLFGFQASDTFGDTSATILHFLTVR